MSERTLLIQLPLNPQAPLEPTGNTPLAGAILSSVSGSGTVSVLGRDKSDILGDRALVYLVRSISPDRVGFTLYCWNVERSLRLARELRGALPEIGLIGGGPEVTEDNHWLLETGVFDVLLAGEGESEAELLLGSGFRGGTEQGTVLLSGSSHRMPGSWPNPYLNGVLDPASGEAVLVETIRGCSSTCGYCAYRRSHPVPRMMPAERVLELLRGLKDAGAEEVVFLDPTFNARPDLDILLKGMEDVGLAAFGEMRGESITPVTASAVRRAGFGSAEIGLQTMDSRVLEQAGRFGDPEAVLKGAAHLASEGVTPLLDLILGLPGDTPGNAVRTAEILRERGLHGAVQVFHLAVLPGTRTGGMGHPAMELPPYYRFIPPDMNGWAQAREDMADILGYDLDLAPRPLLFDGWDGTRVLDLDWPGRSVPDIPSLRHAVLRVRSKNLWENFKAMESAVRRRLSDEPHCVLDLVLQPSGPFPFDLISRLKRLCEPVDYSGRTASALARDGNLRLFVHIDIEREDRFHRDWMIALTRECPVVLDTEDPDLLPPGFLESGGMARLPGSEYDLSSLKTRVPSLHQLLFRSRRMEQRWSDRVFGANAD